jgi:diguanylate cyclase (GGDEF)-like protein
VAAGAGIALCVLGGPVLGSPVTRLFELGCTFVAVRSIWRRAKGPMRHGPPMARAFIFIELGLLALLVADGFGSTAQLTARATFAIHTEVAGVIAAALLITGLMTLVRDRTGSWDIDSLLEATLAASFAVFLVWAGLVQRSTPVDRAAMTFGLARPGMDLVVVLLALRQLQGDDVSRFCAVPWRCVAGAALGQVVADIARSAAPLGGPHIAGGLVAPLVLGTWTLLATAGLHPDAAGDPGLIVAPPSRLDLGRLSLVMAAALAGPIIGTAEIAQGRRLHGEGIAVGTVILTCLGLIYLVRRVEEGARSRHLALHDDVTGLPNRLLFCDRVSSALVQAERTGEITGLLFLDLDRFKVINGRLGHAAGNELLHLVGQRLAQVMGDDDIVARLAGDEFTVLLPRLPDGDAVMARVDRARAAFVAPFRVAGGDLLVTASMGIAIAPDDAEGVEALLANAEAAMCRAKAAGRDTYRLYVPEMHTRARKRVVLRSGLDAAISGDELVLHYQPKIDLRTGALVGMEALARWQHPQRGLVQANEFISLAEETGLIIPLGEWALNAACAQTQQWRQAGHDLIVSVNVSPRQFQQQRMADVVARILRRTGLEAHALELEFTESAVLDNPTAIISTLQDIKTMGVSCLIDDFGTGRSALSYLAQLPIDALKIDKSFICKIARGEDEDRMVVALIALGHQLRLAVSAEGVETLEQLTFLQGHGCDTMQGYLISQPLPAAEFAALLSELPTIAGGISSPPMTPRQLGPGAKGIVTLRRLLYASVWDGLPWAQRKNTPTSTS